MEAFMEIYPSEVIEIITDLLFIGQPIEKLPAVDLILVFGSDFIKGTVDAIEEIISQKKLSENGKIVFSGATGSLNAGKESEALRMAAEIKERHIINENRILTECNATNAYQNLEFSKTLIENNGGFEQYDKILFVGKAFMLRRTQMCAKRLGYPMGKIYYHGLVDYTARNIAPDNWWIREDARKRVMEEVERIGKYSAKGDLDIF
jgi:Uncharacterized conserved protein